MKDPTDLPHVRRRVSKGRTYWRFERKSRGVSVALPSPEKDLEAFHAAYQKALSGKAEPDHRHNFTALIASYRKSPRFTGLKPRTQADYLKALDFIGEKLGMETDDMVYMTGAEAEPEPHCMPCTGGRRMLFGSQPLPCC